MTGKNTKQRSEEYDQIARDIIAKNGSFYVQYQTLMKQTGLSITGAKNVIRRARASGTRPQWGGIRAGAGAKSKAEQRVISLIDKALAGENVSKELAAALLEVEQDTL